MKTADCYVIVLSGKFLAWDPQADEALVFTDEQSAHEEARSNWEEWERYAVAKASLDGDQITVDWIDLVWQTFPPKEHSVSGGQTVKNRGDGTNDDA